jgi:predicted dehydrogenase
VVGAGAFGRNHLRVYRELEQAGAPVELAAIVDPNEATRSAATAKYAISGFASIDECLAACKLDAASLCVPTVHHAACARTLLAAGVDLLIEKPIAAGLAEADEIVSLAHELGRTVHALRSLLNHPMFFEVHRLSVFTPRSLDVDVVLDLMVHDLDIVLSLVASPVRELRAVGLPVLSPRVDIANVRLEFENGCVANFTASRVSTERVRKMRFFQPHQYLSLDFARQDLLLIDVTAASGLDPAQLAALASAATAGGQPAPGLSLSKLPVEPGEPLRLEIESFLDAVRGRTQPVVTAEDGRAALALALQINAAIAAHARRTGL